MVAFVPLKVTVFSDLVELKLVPVIVTLVPVGPTLGLMPLMVSCSSGSGVTVKEGPVAVCPFVVTFTGPLVAPCGTVTTSLVVEALLIVALVPLNITVFFDFVLLKFLPVIVTFVPTGPFFGLRPVTCTCGMGFWVISKLGPLAVWPFTVTFTGPSVAF